MKSQDQRAAKARQIKENPDKRVKLWTGHFGILIGQPAINTTASLTRAIIGHILPINTNNFTME